MCLESLSGVLAGGWEFVLDSSRFHKEQQSQLLLHEQDGFGSCQHHQCIERDVEDLPIKSKSLKYFESKWAARTSLWWALVSLVTIMLLNAICPWGVLSVNVSSAFVKRDRWSISRKFLPIPFPKCRTKVPSMCHPSLEKNLWMMNVCRREFDGQML